jgi:ABC-type oligopeptide transport system ATPase subunit
MKWFIIIASLTVLLSCKQSEMTTDANNSTQKENITEATPIKEALFLTMERTPCLGRCPNYKITIMNTGKVIYEGKQFSEPLGQYTKMLSSKQLSEIQQKMENINLFELNDKYDSRVTDISAVAIFVVYKGAKKKIYDRHGGQKELGEFEELIDTIVIDDQLIKVEE